MASLGKLPVWDLTDMYSGASDPAARRDAESVVRKSKAFRARFEGRVRASNLREAFVEYEKIAAKASFVSAYASLLESSDSANLVWRKFAADIGDILASADLETVFFNNEVAGLKAADIDFKKLEPYSPLVRRILKHKEHQLSLELETFVSDISAADAYWGRLRAEVMGRLRFEVGGKTLTEPEAASIVGTSRDRAERREAWTALAKGYDGELAINTIIMNSIAKSGEVGLRWRGHDDVAAARHIANQVEPEVVDALVKAVTASYPAVSHRFYEIKARSLRIGKVQPWDRTAPFPDAPSAKIPWEQARETVLAAYSGFDDEIGRTAKLFFDNGWIDAEVRPNKDGGGFNMAVTARHHPYVLVNYLGSPRDVATLAHEIGHGIHSVLAGRNNTDLLMHPPLTLAETASVFGEMLTFRHLLASNDVAGDPKSRRAMLLGKAQDMINTVCRQTCFYVFERAVHEARAAEGDLGAERIGELWRTCMAEANGPACAWPDAADSGWSAIPHFFDSPFYTYAYAFGDCLVNSLWKLYEDDSVKDFPAKYKALLAAGGSKGHKELLKPFGLDAADPKFWRAGLKAIEDLLDEAESL